MSTTTRRRAAQILFGAAVSVSLAGCSAFPDSSSDGSLLESIEDGHVTVGSAFTNPGLSTRDDDGSVAGLDTDVAAYVINAIADKNGWSHPQIQWRHVPEGQRADMLNHAYVDMVASTYSMNQERAAKTAFAGPYLLTHQALLVRDGTDEFSDVESLGGRSLCFVTGTTAAGTIKTKLPDAVLEEYDSYDACLNALRNGHVEAVTTDAAILEGFEAREQDMFDVVPLEMDGHPLTDEHYGLGLRDHDEATITAVNNALKQMYEDGSFDRFVTQNLQADPDSMRDTPGDTSFLDAEKDQK